ncbi:MAG: hypothetical protein GXO82_07195 [Chlorobi bacterium]|nr:hypothetical protein [Chlorobiota bacterium]
MKNLLMLMIPLLILITSCEDANQPSVEDSITLEPGHYKGTYTYTWQIGSVDEDSVTCDTELTLFEGGYSIEEIQNNCPPHSAGPCEITPTTITFQDTVVHTAEFDNTLIIHGTYVYTFEDPALEMSQMDTSLNRKYVYRLTKTN